MPAPSVTSQAQIVASARHLLEQRGFDALTMRAIAAAVGVKGPSLYKHVRGRQDVLRLVLDQVADELTAALDAAASSGDPLDDLRAMMGEHRRFAHANPVTYGLLLGADSVAGAEARSRRTGATLLARVAEVAGPENALPAARTLVAWAHGFIGMTLASSFRLGGDIEEAWTFGLERILDAIDSR